MNEIVMMYRFSEFIGKTNYEINNNVYSIVYIDDKELFFSNLDLFNKILKTKRYGVFYSYDMDVLKIIENMLPEKYEIGYQYELALLDDFKNIDRSYIDLNYFKKSIFLIPISYILWNLDFSDGQSFYCYNVKNTYLPLKVIGFNKITKEELIKIQNLIKIISVECNGCTDIEKLIIISNYFQKYIQFVDEKNISKCLGDVYITDSRGIDVNLQNVRNVSNILFNHFGVCEGIANASTMLLNNPLIEVNTRSIRGSGHAWNIVSIDGKYYYFDNTWAITRNSNKFPESLKASSFDLNYLLFGENTAKNIGYHVSESYSPCIELFDYPQRELEIIQKKLSKKIDFYHYELPVFQSKIKK